MNLPQDIAALYGSEQPPTDTERSRLAEWLRADPAHLRILLRERHFDAVLRDAVRDRARREPIRFSLGRWQRWAWPIAAMLVIGLAWLAWPRPIPPGPAMADGTYPALADWTGTVQVTADGRELSAKRGMALPLGSSCRATAGILRWPDGTTGDWSGSIRISSSTELFLDSGRLTVIQVAAAKRWWATPHGQVQAAAAEFQLAASATGTEILVARGPVEVSGGGSRLVAMTGDRAAIPTGGMAMLVATGKPPAASAADPTTAQVKPASVPSASAGQAVPPPAPVPPGQFPIAEPPTAPPAKDPKPAGTDRPVRAGDLEALLFTDAAGKLPYRLFRPAGPGPFPVVLFLHGIGERGDDNLRQLRNDAILALAQPASQRILPCLLVAPQCPSGGDWRKPELVVRLWRLIDALEKTAAADPKRIAITGLSTGGFACWTLAAAQPGRVAAIVPVAGSGGADPAVLDRIAIWAHHGAADPTVPVAWTRTLVAAVRARGRPVDYSEYPGAGHAVWDRAYRDPRLPAWLAAQRAGQVQVPLDRLR